MPSTSAPQLPPKLTPRGQTTRARILEHAAALIYAKGVHATNNEELRRLAGVSGSQLNHYFPTKESLVIAVIEWQADQTLALHRGEQFFEFISIEGFRKWADFYVGRARPPEDGCSLGSLASEVVKSGLNVSIELSAAFERWRDVFYEGLLHMQRSSRLRPDADPGRMANLLLSALQGGMLLAQITRDITPVKDALGSAIDYVETFSTQSQ